MDKRTHTIDELRVLFMNHVVKTSSCWLWIAATDKEGYGKCSFLGEWRANRVAYRLFKGKIPRGYCVCHNCDNPGCVNPNHLFIGTQADNIRDKVKKCRQARGLGHAQYTCPERMPRGSTHGMAVIDEEIAHRIKQALKVPDANCRQIARDENVTKYIVYNIKYGTTWKHI